MIKMSFVFVFSLMGLGMILSIWSFFKFDVWVRKIYEESRAYWENLGMPTGFFWVPRELKGLNGKSLQASANARNELYLAFMDDEPSIDQGKQEHRNYWRLSRAGIFFFACALLCFVVLLLVSFIHD